MRGLEELPYAAGLMARIPGHLGRPLAVDEARAIAGRRLAEREAAFLRLVRGAVLERAESPYRRLFELAGCQHGDVHRMVRDEGLEGALAALATAGIYLTVDEFKGRKPVVRGSATIDVSTNALRNPLARRHVPARSSGSRGRPTHVHFGLPYIRDCAVDTLLHLDSRGGADWVKAIWENPGAGAMFRLLKYGSFGRPVERWFTPVAPSTSGLHPRYAWGERAVRLASAVAGRAVPRPEIASAVDPLPVARWMQEVLRRGGVPHVLAYVSAAVRLASAALEAGIDIAGAQVTAAGEPVTAARLAAIRRAGVAAVPRYGSIETGPIGYACLAPSGADDVHVLSDLVALVQAGGALGALPRDALLVTGLRVTAPFVLLNVSTGDSAALDRRACGCRLEALGWAEHLSSIRSFEKLTAGGMTFLGTDLVRALEEVLPARFGGEPTDYQLVEGEPEDGSPRITLRVDPRLGTLRERELLDVLLQSVGRGDGGERVMTMLWDRQGVLRVERVRPETTGSGKFPHIVWAKASRDGGRSR